MLGLRKNIVSGSKKGTSGPPPVSFELGYSADGSAEYSNGFSFPVQGNFIMAPASYGTLTVLKTKLKTDSGIDGNHRLILYEKDGAAQWAEVAATANIVGGGGGVFSLIQGAINYTMIAGRSYAIFSLSDEPTAYLYENTGNNSQAEENNGTFATNPAGYQIAVYLQYTGVENTIWGEGYL